MPLGWQTHRPRSVSFSFRHCTAIPDHYNSLSHLDVLVSQVYTTLGPSLHLYLDLKAVYSFLQEHCAVANAELLQASSNQVFLNVDDPDDGASWVFRSASQLVFMCVIGWHRMRAELL
jgi:hypothetical protein